MLTHSNSKRGSTFVEAAITFPLVIIIVAMTIHCAVNLYTKLKDNSVEHKESINKTYEIYEKGRLYISLYGHHLVIDDGAHGNVYPS